MENQATLPQKVDVTQPLSFRSSAIHFGKACAEMALETALELNERIKTVLYRYPLSSAATSGALVATLAPFSLPLSFVSTVVSRPAFNLLYNRKKVWLEEFRWGDLSSFRTICESTENLKELTNSLTPEEIASTNDLQLTLLHTAILTDQFVLASQLIPRMSAKDLSLQDTLERTTLHLAIDKNKTALAKQIAVSMYPEDLGLQDNEKAIPLHSALLRDETEELACLLIEKMLPKHLEIPFLKQETPLHTAIRKNKRRIVSLLLQKIQPTALEKQDQEGRTPLDLALDTWDQNLSLAMIQKAHPSLFRLKNQEGETVVDWVERQILICKMGIERNPETEEGNAFREVLAFFQRIHLEIHEKLLSGPTRAKHLLQDAS